jgi:magnesium-transporting ATPase (P-type)
MKENNTWHLDVLFLVFAILTLLHNKSGWSKDNSSSLMTKSLKYEIRLIMIWKSIYHYRFFPFYVNMMWSFILRTAWLLIALTLIALCKLCPKFTFQTQQAKQRPYILTLRVTWRSLYVRYSRLKQLPNPPSILTTCAISQSLRW